MTHEELELSTNILDLSHSILCDFEMQDSSRKFVKTENIKCDLRIIIVMFFKASATTK